MRLCDREQSNKFFTIYLLIWNLNMNVPWTWFDQRLGLFMWRSCKWIKFVFGSLCYILVALPWSACPWASYHKDRPLESLSQWSSICILARTLTLSKLNKDCVTCENKIFIYFPFYYQILPLIFKFLRNFT